jgi:hypothetical protein
MLVFDPIDGKLSLRRIILTTRTADSVSSVLSSLPIPGGTSISLPGVGLVGRSISSSSSSPPTIAIQSKASGLTKMMEPPAELVAADSTIATWPLLRGMEWDEVKKKIVEGMRVGRVKHAKSEYVHF